MIDAIQKYAAALSRDNRFDGLFFVAVNTTGVYCRPVCPAPKPKLENVLFYPTAAAAEQAGFRPCKRCRPETSPGTPVWRGTSTSVNRGLRLIESGYLDDHSVTELAERLGMGDRHLRRLFQKHLGAPPHAVARIRRTNFAIGLIEQTCLPMTEIAFASGFESIRRFNDEIKKRFGASPSELRSRSQKDRGSNHQDEIQIKLTYRPPLDWKAMLNYLKKREILGVEYIEKDSYFRAIRTNKGIGVIEVLPCLTTHPCLELKVKTQDSSSLMKVVNRIRRMFDLDADLLTITAHLEKDPLLAPIVRANQGLRLPGAWDHFELAIRTVIGQQISLQAANTITARLVEKYGASIKIPEYPRLRSLFPGPEPLANADFRSLGLPQTRIKTLQILSRQVADGQLDLESGTDLDLLRKKLAAIPGIGSWTTEYLALRMIVDPDAFPETDLALKRSLQRIERLSSQGAYKIKRPQSWKPWRAYGAMYLWRNYANSIQE